MDKNKPIQIVRAPWRLSKFNNPNKTIFELQKAYFLYNKEKYQKVTFSEEEIPALATLLKKSKLFRKEYRKAK